MTSSELIQNTIHADAERPKPTAPSAESGSPKSRCPESLRDALRTGRGPQFQTIRRELLSGSRLLVVLSGYPGESVKRAYFQRLKELGVEVILLDLTCNDNDADDLVRNDLVNRRLLVQDVTDVREALRIIHQKDLRLDGVVTFVEFGIPLVAQLAEALNLPGNPIQAVRKGRDKELTRHATAKAGLPTPRFFRIRSRADLERAAQVVGFPAILKPVAGLTAVEVHHIESWNDLLRCYGTSQATTEGNASQTGAAPESLYRMIWHDNPDMILEERLAGREFDVDLLLSEGECIYAAITENLMHPRWRQVQIGATMPASLDQNEAESLRQLAIKATQGLGYRCGVFHVEVKEGPALLEINARVGGASQYELNRDAWGVDLVEEHAMASVGIPILPDVPDQPLRHFAGHYPLATDSGPIRHPDFLADVRPHPDLLVCDPWVELGDQVRGPVPGPPSWLGEIVIGGDTLGEAEQQLRRLISQISDPLKSPL